MKRRKKRRKLSKFLFVIYCFFFFSSSSFLLSLPSNFLVFSSPFVFFYPSSKVWAGVNGCRMVQMMKPGAVDHSGTLMFEAQEARRSFAIHYRGKKTKAKRKEAERRSSLHLSLRHSSFTSSLFF